MKKLIAQGAEGKIYLENKKIIKERIPKGYRIREIDEKIRKQRTRKEASLLEKLKGKINVPKIIQISQFNLEIEYIEGEKLSQTLNTYSKKKQTGIMNKLGKEIGKMHDLNIIHGDLTTSNTILKNNKVFIIDFGLGFVSLRLEDKAVDLHLIKQALEAKHFQNHEELFKSFLNGYKPKDKSQILEQLKKVESRGRNKHQ